MSKEYYIGQIILEKGKYKVIREIGDGWIETIYLHPSKQGWKRVEKLSTLPPKPVLTPLKISDYCHLATDIVKLEELMMP